MKFKNKREKVFVVSIVEKDDKNYDSWVTVLPNRIICKTYEECYNFIKAHTHVVNYNNENGYKRLWQIWEDTYNDSLNSPTITHFDFDMNEYTTQKASEYLNSD